MIESLRVVLRPTEMSDLEDIQKLYSDRVAMKYITGEPMPPEKTLEAIHKGFEHWQNFGYGMFTMIEKSTGDFIGRCGLIHLQPSEIVEVGYILCQSKWGCGYATEAAKRVVRYAFEDIKLPQLHGFTFLQNLPSQKILMSCGLKFCGTRHLHGHHLLEFAIK